MAIYFIVKGIVVVILLAMLVICIAGIIYLYDKENHYEDHHS